MGKFFSALMTLCVGIVWSAAAFAVTDGSFTPTDETGKPLQSATVTISVVKQSELPKPPARRHVVKRIHTHTTTTGRTELTYDETRIDRDDYVVIVVVTQDGRTYSTTRPITSLGGGVPVMLTPGLPMVATTTPVPFVPALPGIPGAPFSGYGVSGFLSGNFGDQTIREYFTRTGDQTNVLADQNTRIGGGLSAFYNFAVYPGLLAGPFVTVNFPNQAITRTFPGGSRIGTTDDVVVTFGGQLGIPVITQDGTQAFLYLRGGVSEMQEKLRINFIGMPASVDTRTVWGGTFGVGGMVRRPDWRIGNFPIAAFGEIDFTGWQNGRFVGPLGSPLFTYVPERNDVVFLVGGTMLFNSDSR